MVSGVEFDLVVGNMLMVVVDYFQFLLRACVLWVVLFDAECAVVCCVEFDFVVGYFLQLGVSCIVFPS